MPSRTVRLRQAGRTELANLRQTGIRRRADGAIDTAFYVANARAIRRADLQRCGRSLLKLLRAWRRSMVPWFRSRDR